MRDASPTLVRVMRITLVFFTACLGMASATIHDVRGYHSFANHLNSRWSVQPPLVASGFSAAYVTDTLPDGGSSSCLGAPALGTGQSLALTNWAASNGGAGNNGGAGATQTNRWTLLMDIKVLPVAGTNWVSLMQTTAANNDDGEVFLNADGRVFAGGVTTAANTVTANTWHRLAIVCDNNGAGGTLTVTVYRNGTPILTSSGHALNERFAIGSTLLLLADDNNETSACRLNALAFWTEALTPQQIQDLGGAKATDPEFQWSSMPVSTARPGLTGNFTFGSYALSLPASGALLGNGIVSLTSGAFIPGYPGYTLTGTHAMRLAATGDLVYTGTGASIAGETPVRLNHVLVTPGTIQLASTGATASNYRLRLPVGLSAGPASASGALPYGTRKMTDLANIGTRSLSAGLSPGAGGITLLPTHFGFPAGNVVLALESRPVRYTVPQFAWAPSTGAFQIESTTNVAFDRFYERFLLAYWNAFPAVTGDIRPSNDDLFAYAAGMETTIIDTNSSGMASLRQGVQNFTTSTDGFIAHYPLVRVKWNSATGSRIRHQAGTLQTDSQLTAGLSDTFSFTRNPKGSGCGVLAPAKTLNFTPANDWKITRDGGLHAVVNFSGTTAQRTLEWGAIDASTFAHKIDTPISSAALSIPGNSLAASQVPGLPLADRPAALLLSGNGNGTLPETVIERPGQAAYATGAADYAGMNVRITSNGSHTATSRLAGWPVSYPLRNTSKYNVRVAGITGVHDAVAQAAPPGQSYPIQTILAGYAVGLSDVRLSFRDSHNIQSGVNGAFNIPAPASLPDLAVNNLRFGPRGELLDASFVLPGEMTLGYWGCKITPHAMLFARSNTPCANPAEATLVLGAEVSLPALSDEKFTGNIGFKPDGHTVTANDNQEANGQAVNSRLRPPNNLSIKGPGNLTYPFTPTARGAWLNEFSGAPPVGFVAMPGEMNVPFFRDLKVLLQARSSAGATQDSTLSVLAGDSPTFHFFAAADPDPGNLGTQPGLPGPRARRKLWDLIDMDLPLSWNNTLRRFNGESEQAQLLLFELDQRCSTLGPQVAEINFGVSANPVAKTISAATLLDAAGADTKGLLSSITGPASGLLNEALSSLKLTEDLGEAALDKLLGPGIDAACPTIAGTLFDSLAAHYNAAGGNLATYKANAANHTAFTTAANSLVGQIGTLPTGTWRTEIRNRLTSAITVCQRLESIAQNSAHILSLANAIGQSTGGGNAASIDALGDTLADLLASIVTLRTQLEQVRAGFDAPGSVFSSLLQTQLSSMGPWITPAVDSLKSDWITNLPDPSGSGYFTAARRSLFIAQFQQRVRSAFLGSVTEQNLRQVLTEITGDPLNRLRNAMDGIIDVANSAFQSTNALPDPTSTITTLGSFSDVFSGGKLTGYARINGESLKELRLDGELTLKVPDDMTLRAWFLMRDMDGSMPGDKALEAGGVKTEVVVGAATPLNFLGQADAYASAELRVGIGDSGPVAVAGSLDITGEIDFESIKVSQIHFALAIGAVDCYVGAKVVGELDTGYFIIGAEVAVFLGKTSRMEPVAKVNAGVAGLLTNLGFAEASNASPLYGAYVFAYGDFSVLSLLGIPPTCLLDIRLGGGQGNYIFYRNGIGAMAGMQFVHSIRGRALCLVNVGGRLEGLIAGAYSTANGKSASFANLKAAGRLNAQLTGTVGISPFSYTWKKNFGFDVTIDPAASPKTSWSVQY